MRAKENRKLAALRILDGTMQFGEFEEQIFSIDRAIHRQISQDRPTTEASALRDLSKLRATVRRAAEDLILCSDVDHAIGRLRRNAEASAAIKALTIEAPLSRDDHKSAAQRAFEATPGEPESLPFYPYCSYLVELCNALELADYR